MSGRLACLDELAVESVGELVELEGLLPSQPMLGDQLLDLDSAGEVAADNEVAEGSEKSREMLVLTGERESQLSHGRCPFRYDRTHRRSAPPSRRPSGLGAGGFRRDLGAVSILDIMR